LVSRPSRVCAGNMLGDKPAR